MKESPERLVVEATREKLTAAWRKLAGEMCCASSAQSSWSLMQELDGYSKDGKRLPKETVKYDEKNHKDVEASYKASIEKLEAEVERWEKALTHAITALEMQC